MVNPETTSAEGLESHHDLGGTCLLASNGEAWSDLRASVYTVPSQGTVFTPSISEPVLSWTRSGEVEIEDREVNGPWVKSLIKKGSFFLISGGAPYYCRWKTISAEPHEYMLVVLALPLLQRAFGEVFGSDASKARLRDISGLGDATLNGLMEQVYTELTRKKASPLRVQGLARLVAIHLVENYSETIEGHHDSPALPGFKLKQITDWMAEHVADDFNLDQLAGMAGLSRFHFHRLFKKATGFSPSRYHINLRMSVARRLLRETKTNILDVALEVGYTNPSHFAHVFRRDTGLSPSDYRHQR